MILKKLREQTKVLTRLKEVRSCLSVKATDYPQCVCLVGAPSLLGVSLWPDAII
jgi:hypothetical protein